MSLLSVPVVNSDSDVVSPDREGILSLYWNKTEKELRGKEFSGNILEFSDRPNVLKGTYDASTNPDLPEANKGETFIVSLGGKAGGINGEEVQIGDLMLANADTVAGSFEAVGSNWEFIQSNIDFDNADINRSKIFISQTLT